MTKFKSLTLEELERTVFPVLAVRKRVNALIKHALTFAKHDLFNC